MLLIGLRKGGVKCSSACPFYTETGRVRGFNGTLKTHCRMTMHPWMADCDLYDPCHIDTVEVTEGQWQTMLAAVKKNARRQRKLYPEEHAEIHAVGCEWTRSKGRWNADKSSTPTKLC